MGRFRTASPWAARRGVFGSGWFAPLTEAPAALGAADVDDAGGGALRDAQPDPRSTAPAHRTGREAGSGARRIVGRGAPRSDPRAAAGGGEKARRSTGRAP